MNIKTYNVLAFLSAMFLIVSCEESEINELALDQELIIEKPASSAVEIDEYAWDSLMVEVSALESGARIADVSGMDVPKENPKKVYVHYMPWFQSKDYDGWWGQHWTMTNQDPEIIDEDGKRQIASYLYPMIGPYSSKDPHLQQYHFLMMKLAGVDGVIFDWYGSRDLYDYQLLKDATESFMETLEDLEMDFSIMYEDRVAVQAYEQGLANSVEEAAQEDLLYMYDEYFTSERYIKWDDKNSLYVFGPHHITQPSQWSTIFSVLPPEEKPSFLTLWASQHNVGECAAGEFLWIAPDHLAAHEYYYSIYPENNKITVGSVYPGFKSFYTEGGWSDGANDWELPWNDGETFIETLNYTHHEVADFIQIATWNDFGEGTAIEPTGEFGFMYLQLLQQYTGADHTPEDLQVALELYQTRKKYKDNPRVQRLLDRCYVYMKARRIDLVAYILSLVNRYL